MLDRNILQTQPDRRLLQESEFSLHGINHAHRQRWPGNRQRIARQAATTAHIEQRHIGHIREHHQ